MIFITSQWLKEKTACPEVIVWFTDRYKADGIAGDLLMEALIKDKKLDWANWVIVRMLSYKDYVSYAVFAAESCVDIYEKEYPKDKRPREAIETAKKCIDNPSKENKLAANAAAYAAYAAAYAANPTYATYALKLKILEYGITLLRGGK